MGLSSLEIAKTNSELQRHEAKQIALKMFGIKKNQSNGNVERFVDCIIGAAILETSILMTKAISQEENDA